MKDELEQPSDVSELMPCPLDLSLPENKYAGPIWTFWSSRPNDELEYQCEKMAAPVVPTYSGIGKDTIKSISQANSLLDFCLIQFWSPVKVNGSNFLSTANQPFALIGELNKRLCTYRRHCLDTLIPVDIDCANGEVLPARVFIRGFPEYSRYLQNYSAVEFPLLKRAIQLGIQSYYAIPVFKLHENHCRGVFEITSKDSDFYFPYSLKELVLGSSELYIPRWPEDIRSNLLQRWKVEFRQIKAGLDMVRRRQKLPFAQIWIPDTEPNSTKALIATSHDESIDYYVFENTSAFSYIQSGRAVVGRAFSSQETCFCKDVTLLSLLEYPLVRIAREAEFTECFAICLRSKCTNDFVCVVECFLPHNEMVDRGAKTFLNMLLSTMKEQLPGFIVASGKELGQRMAVEVVKVSPSDDLNSFEIGQPLPGVQSLQDGGETTEIDSLGQLSYLQHVENNVTTEQLVPFSSHMPASFNCERPVQVDTPTLVPHQTDEAVMVNVDVVHDDHIEFEKDTGEINHSDSHFEQPNVEFDIMGNARSNDKGEHDSNIISGAVPSTQRTDSQMSSKLPRIEKDHAITREKLEEQFGKTLTDAAKNLSVSRSTLKRICREYDVFRWPHHKTRKVNHHASKAVAVQGVEPYVEDQERPNISREKGTDCVAHERSPATGKACDSVMTIKVKYRDDIMVFELTLSSTRVELQREVEKRLSISLEKFIIKYQDKDDEWITIYLDSDLRKGMKDLRLLGRTTMRLLVTPKSYT